jgi:hypothetical protein
MVHTGQNSPLPPDAAHTPISNRISEAQTPAWIAKPVLRRFRRHRSCCSIAYVTQAWISSGRPRPRSVHRGQK